ncbi:hypothetical protein DIU31_007565 [Mucilaginibacter rubeus]|uniref:Uncharacterized protein n=1 Tax=Mucilaginibacter rubeus TaxID=2027860 RepID=A0AAE6JD64_9SPHI|nr:MULTISPECIES: hypothetical protein [Mucilaginibacter]QEM03386.1 hypothetical protein DIU31_007565 [Mucilaginibacter rubeus]QEM16002.1 hypothetical protein DIU38_007645 [Mucilaginibacter gossypii]QTE41250.1 hypothetical protein J3L19_20115 [Mucilaginibacter rubeus]QTE47854.1 hypothetical protein J3L21_20100 [Mucilaginibacter rubeus]QTE59247.1 hypothetical protein J3L23_11770 [Mucilaginibacter rubeus]
MINKLNKGFLVLLAFSMMLVIHPQANAQTITLNTKFVTLSINKRGFITSIKDKSSHKEYCPAGKVSALLSLYKGENYILPVAAAFNTLNKRITLRYPNGSVATVQTDEKGEYVRLKLVSLKPRNGVDNIVWGPYKLTISKTIGDILGVVRDDDFAFGILGLNDNTTSGPPTGGDMSFMYYFIHSPDPLKYPLPPNLKEGQTFTIGGDGINDVAFYSHPEEYYRMNYGNGARLEPAFGSTVCMHSRDRRKEQMIRFPVLPDNLDGKVNSARYQLVPPVNADFIGSSVALLACPDSVGLRTIEQIVLKEGLPHPEIDGQWIKDPKAYRPDIAWHGVHDSLITYAHQLAIKGVQDEGWGEYYPNPQNRWTNRKINFNNAAPMDIPQYGALMKKNGIRYGLHTLCEFLQPDNNSDVAPVPSDSLAIMQRTSITKNLTDQDTVITVADRAYFNEFGGWEGNHTNVLKIGKELIEYNGISESKPYTFLHIKRGLYGTKRGAYKKGATIVKLQPNCYRGFVPDMNLQKVYADYYGKWLKEGGMDYIDFDGLESCIYQGQGQYSFKQFFRKLFDSYAKNGGDYLRVMGSAVYEGNWHYMSVCNVGGGNNMFNPVLNQWGIEGKDMRYVFESSYLPATFGIVDLQSDWSLYDAENLEAKSIGWNATYMLGLSQHAVENCPEKNNIFKAYRAWENARALNIFTKTVKERLKDLNFKFHLVQNGEKSFVLYPVRETRFTDQQYTIEKNTCRLNNEFDAQPLDCAIRISSAEKDGYADGIRITFQDGTELSIDKKITNGEFIILKDNACYVADKNRKKIAEIPTRGNLSLPHGASSIQVSALHNSNQKVNMELLVSSVGPGIAL